LSDSEIPWPVTTHSYGDGWGDKSQRNQHYEIFLFFLDISWLVVSVNNWVMDTRFRNFTSYLTLAGLNRGITRNFLRRSDFRPLRPPVSRHPDRVLTRDVSRGIFGGQPLLIFLKKTNTSWRSWFLLLTKKGHDVKRTLPKKHPGYAPDRSHSSTVCMFCRKIELDYILSI